MFPLPGDKASQRSVFFNPLGSIGITNTTSNPAAARAFVDFTQRPAQASLMARVSGVISQTDFAKGIMPSNLSGLAATAKLKSQIVSNVTWPAATKAVLVNAADGMITGQVTVDQALANLDKAWG
jgi:ABC-type glycerol-3-phosphate transport system substrate-binding protein